MGCFTAFTTVMIPRVSELLSKGDNSQLQRIYNQTIQLLFVLSLPIICYCLFCTEDIILLLSGTGYEGAYTPFRIVILLLLVIGMEQIVIQQFLMATTSNKSILKVSTVGAVVGIVGNLLLTPHLEAIGSSISWGISEVSVLIIGLISLRKLTGINFTYKLFAKDILYVFLYIPPLYLIKSLDLSIIPNLLLSGVALMAVFVLINIVINRNEILYDISKKSLGYITGPLKDK